MTPSPSPSPFITYALYEGRLVPKVDLADQFARFAAMIKSNEPVGTGNEESPLSNHLETILKCKENDY